MTRILSLSFNFKSEKNRSLIPTSGHGLDMSSVNMRSCYPTTAQTCRSRQDLLDASHGQHMAGKEGFDKAQPIRLIYVLTRVSKLTLRDCASFHCQHVFGHSVCVFQFCNFLAAAVLLHFHLG